MLLCLLRCIVKYSLFSCYAYFLSLVAPCFNTYYQLFFLLRWIARYFLLSLLMHVFFPWFHLNSLPIIISCPFIVSSKGECQKFYMIQWLPPWLIAYLQLFPCHHLIQRRLPKGPQDSTVATLIQSLIAALALPSSDPQETGRRSFFFPVHMHFVHVISLHIALQCCSMLLLPKSYPSLEYLQLSSSMLKLPLFVWLSSMDANINANSGSSSFLLVEISPLLDQSLTALTPYSACSSFNDFPRAEGSVKRTTKNLLIQSNCLKNFCWISGHIFMFV